MNAAKHWVLIVEDEVKLAQSIKENLELDSYFVHTVDKVVDAKMKLRNQKFDFILLDLKINQGTGVDVLDFISANDKNDNYYTPVIVMSGFLDPEVIRSLGNRVQGVLVKPFDFDALKTKMSEAAQKAKARIHKHVTVGKS